MENDAPSFPPLRAVAAAPAPEPWGWCHMYVIPNPDEEPLEAIAALADQSPAQNQVGRKDITFETLPVGTAAKVSHTMRFDDERGSHYMYSHSYTWAADVAFYTLSCSGQQPPDDHWLSIAETFDFLDPAG